MENQENKPRKREPMDYVREWVTPILLSIVGLLMWRDLSEMRADVKQLLIEQNTNRVEIQAIKTDLCNLKSFVYTQAYSTEEKPNKQKHYDFQKSPAIKEDEVFIQPKQDKNGES